MLITSDVLLSALEQALDNWNKKKQAISDKDFDKLEGAKSKALVAYGTFKKGKGQCTRCMLAPLTCPTLKKRN